MERVKGPGPRVIEKSKAVSYMVLFSSLGLIIGFAVGFALSNQWNKEAFENLKSAPAAGKAGAKGKPGAQGEDNAMQQVMQHIEMLKQQAVKNPQDPKPLLELGNMYFEVRKMDQAVEWYSKALEIDPKNVNVRTDMASAYFQMGQMDKAEAELQKSLAIDPKHVHSMINLGIVKLQARNDRKGAQELWEKVISMNPEMQPGQLDQIKSWVTKLKEGKNPLER